MNSFWYTFTATLTILTIVGGSLVAASNTFCGDVAQENLLVGQACTAQTISNPISWTWNESTAALASEKFFQLVTALFFISFVFSLSVYHPGGLTWFNQRINHARGGPTPNRLFLPYLFATHGW
ncbi:hypothetical protein EPN81_01510 [Patescibacteria group bacterium]|nr:MAG: hypothetical protein EPN81_01510 [Patescibacteria group bacterium]